MEKSQADENQAAYHEFLAVLNQVFLEALRLAEGDHAEGVVSEEKPSEQSASSPA